MWILHRMEKDSINGNRHWHIESFSHLIAVPRSNTIRSETQRNWKSAYWKKANQEILLNSCDNGNSTKNIYFAISPSWLIRNVKNCFSHWRNYVFSILILISDFIRGVFRFSTYLSSKDKSRLLKFWYATKASTQNMAIPKTMH